MTDRISVYAFLRKIARILKIGRMFIKIYHLKAITLKGLISMSLAKRKYLKLILKAKPIPAETGFVEVHMLLNHGRIYEALWSLYSFVYFTACPCRIVIHDDGTLRQYDLSKLRNLFPGIQIISKHQADSVVLEYFRREGLKLCEKLRKTLPLSCKLFDFQFFLQNDYYISFDSDVLFFSRPSELITGLISNEKNNNLSCLYLPDISYSYSLLLSEIANLMGREDYIPVVNTGIIRAKRGFINFRRIENYLRHSDFWKEDGRAKYFSENTISGMELFTIEADVLPLPKTYTFCPNKTMGEPSDFVSGHYCGGCYWATHLYSYALPYLSKVLIREHSGRQ